MGLAPSYFTSFPIYGQETAILIDQATYSIIEYEVEGFFFFRQAHKVLRDTKYTSALLSQPIPSFFCAGSGNFYARGSTPLSAGRYVILTVIRQKNINGINMVQEAGPALLTENPHHPIKSGIWQASMWLKMRRWQEVGGFWLQGPHTPL